MHEAPCELSARVGIGIASDQVEIKVSRERGGWRRVEEEGKGGRCPQHGVRRQGERCGGGEKAFPC